MHHDKYAAQKLYANQLNGKYAEREKSNDKHGKTTRKPIRKASKRERKKR